MRRTMMQSKIHRATVTGADLDYVGSITLDPVLMELADVLEHEQVHVLDLDNGARFETYAMRGRRGDVIIKGERAHAATRYAQSGGASAFEDSADDSPELHFSDRIAAGAGLCDPDA